MVFNGSSKPSHSIVLIKKNIICDYESRYEANYNFCTLLSFFRNAIFKTSAFDIENQEGNGQQSARHFIFQEKEELNMGTRVR